MIERTASGVPHDIESEVAREFALRHPSTDEVLCSYHLQAQSIVPAVAAAARRAILEGFVAIVEGVHILLDDFEEQQELAGFADRIFKVLVDVADAGAHISHLQVDDKFQNRNASAYLQDWNWFGIREVRADLLRHATSAHVIVHAEADLDTVVHELTTQYYVWTRDPTKYQKPTHIPVARDPHAA